MRIDDLKTGVKKGAGAWAESNDTGLAYGDEMGLLIDPTRPRSGRDKGKVERRVRDMVGAIVRKGEPFVTLVDVHR